MQKTWEVVAVKRRDDSILRLEMREDFGRVVFEKNGISAVLSKTETEGLARLDFQLIAAEYGF